MKKILLTGSLFAFMAGAVVVAEDAFAKSDSDQFLLNRNFNASFNDSQGKLPPPNLGQ